MHEQTESMSYAKELFWESRLILYRQQSLYSYLFEEREGTRVLTTGLATFFVAILPYP